MGSGRESLIGNVPRRRRSDMARELSTDCEIRQVLEKAHTVAVLGCHIDVDRPAFYVPDYLFAAHYHIIPVNPEFLGHTLFNEPFRASLTDIAQPVDVVDVFRRSDWLPDHVP